MTAFIPLHAASACSAPGGAKSSPGTEESAAAGWDPGYGGDGPYSVSSYGTTAATMAWPGTGDSSGGSGAEGGSGEGGSGGRGGNGANGGDGGRGGAGGIGGTGGANGGAGGVSLDGDGDGFVSVQQGGDDCNDDDPDIHPGAVETDGDGIDSNCNGDEVT